MNDILKQFAAALAATLVLALLWTGCSENPADNGDTDTHFEARGVALRIEGIDTVVVDSNRLKKGKIIVKEGITSSYITVQFIRESDGTRGLPDPRDKAYKLGWVIADTSIADVGPETTDGGWMLDIIGKKAGQTTIVIRLMHNDHPDFESIAIPIEVTP